MSKSFGLITYCTLLYIGIGAYWITLSWTILGIHPNQDAVGRLLIIGSLCTLFTAPIIGLIVDQVGCRKITLIGQSFSLVSGLIPSLMFMLGYRLTSLSIYVIALLVSISSILCIASFDRAIKFTVPPNELKRTRTVLSIFQQSAMMIGTGMSGYLIAEYGELFVFPMISILAILSSSVFLIAMKGIKYTEVAATDIKVSHVSSFKGGMQHITQNKALLISALCIAAVYVTAQVINVSLPAFIKLELGDGSSLFGLCEALWALGGITAAILLSVLINYYHLNWMPLASLSCLGFFMVGFACLTNTSLILSLCLIMGALFSISRTLADANVLSLCSHKMIGRVRSNIMAVTSFIGIIIYTIPILAKKIMPSTLYFLVGTITIIISFFLIILYRKNSNSYPTIESISIKNSITPKVLKSSG